MIKKVSTPMLDVEMYRAATRAERNKAIVMPGTMWEQSFKKVLTPERFEALRARALMNIVEAGE